MKHIITTIIFCLTLAACSEPIDSESTETESKQTPAIVAVTPSFSLANLADIIDSIYNLQSIEFLPASKRAKNNFYEFTDSSNVIEFKSYISFQIVTYTSDSAASLEFAKIKGIATILKERRSYTMNIDHLLKKGGISIILADNKIISHDLRCNMAPVDYENNKKLISRIEQQATKSDWVTSFCGWSKVEMK